MDFIDFLDCIKVIDTRVYTNLIQNGDARLLCSRVQGLDGRAVVAGGNHIFLALDGQLSNLGVVDVWNQ